MKKFIAEFCQNHNGNFDTLKRMVAAAAEAGATHGKMQTILADTVTFRSQFEEGLSKSGKVLSIKRPYTPEFLRLKKLEISESETIQFIKSCQEYGLIPMTTCFVRSHAKRLRELGFKSIKVASYDCASFPMLRELKSIFDSVIISTGATFDDEIEHTANIMAGSDFSFLHCVTLYPTPLDKLNLARIQWLGSLAPSVGYSDHSHVADTGLIASKSALTFGANIIERHFSILPPSETKDGPVSINSEQLKDLVQFSKLGVSDQRAALSEEMPDWEIVKGYAKRELSDEELLNRDYYRGRFASPRVESKDGKRMIFNWEETPL